MIDKHERTAETMTEITTELRQLLRTACAASNRDVTRGLELRTRQGATANITIALSLPEIRTLLHGATTPDAWPLPSRRAHAALWISLHHLARQLAACTRRTIDPAAIGAAQTVAITVRDWLTRTNVVIVEPGDTTRTCYRDRPRQPAALRFRNSHYAATANTVVPIRSRRTAGKP